MTSLSKYLKSLKYNPSNITGSWAFHPSKPLKVLRNKELIWLCGVQYSHDGVEELYCLCTIPVGNEKHYTGLDDFSVVGSQAVKMDQHLPNYLWEMTQSVDDYYVLGDTEAEKVLYGPNEES